MTPNARAAFDKLCAMGVSVMPWGKADGYCAATQFVLIWASDDGSEVFADIDGRRVREEVIDGQLVNCMNIREDVHAILRQHELTTDWQNSGQMTIMDGPDAVGYRHDQYCGAWLSGVFPCRPKRD